MQVFISFCIFMAEPTAPLSALHHVFFFLKYYKCINLLSILNIYLRIHAPQYEKIRDVLKTTGWLTSFCARPTAVLLSRCQNRLWSLA